MNIAIIEDNKEDAVYLKNLLQHFTQNTSIFFHIDVYASGEEFLELANQKNYHLLFLDIYMKEIDGIDTAIRFQKIQRDVLYVFLTSSEEDIWRAVKTHGCFDYIKKTELNYPRLQKLLNDVIDKLQLREKKLQFHTGKQDHSLKINDLQCIISRDKYINIIFKNNNEQTYRITFTEIYNLLIEHTCFVLCNRGVLLHMDYIQKNDGFSFTMKSGAQFPIRRMDRKSIIEVYNNYQFECLEAMEVLE